METSKIQKEPKETLGTWRGLTEPSLGCGSPWPPRLLSKMPGSFWHLVLSTPHLVHTDTSPALSSILAWRETGPRRRSGRRSPGPRLPQEQLSAVQTAPSSSINLSGQKLSRSSLLCKHCSEPPPARKTYAFKIKQKPSTLVTVRKSSRKRFVLQGNSHNGIVIKFLNYFHKSWVHKNIQDPVSKKKNNNHCLQVPWMRKEVTRTALPDWKIPGEKP